MLRVVAGHKGCSRAHVRSVEPNGHDARGLSQYTAAQCAHELGR